MKLAQLPHSAAEAQAVIEQRTGVRRSLTQVRAFLKWKFVKKECLAAK